MRRHKKKQLIHLIILMLAVLLALLFGFMIDETPTTVLYQMDSLKWTLI